MNMELNNIDKRERKTVMHGLVSLSQRYAPT